MSPFVRRLLLTVLSAFTVLHLRALQPLHAIDDAHITYRHVLHFLEGHGWVFNVGDGFLSSSAPLYMVLLTGLEGVFRTGDIPLLSALVNMLLDAGLVALAYWAVLPSESRPLRSFFLILPLAFYPRLLDYSGCGMESSLFSLLIVAAGCAWSRGHWNAAGVLFGLTVTTRLDGLLPALACLGLCWREPRRALAAAALGAAAAAPWYLYALWQYGSLLPVTIANKVAPGGLANLSPLLLVLGETSPGSLFLPQGMAVRGYPRAVALGLIWILGFLALYLRQGRPRDDSRRLLLLFLCAPSLFAAAYLLGSPPLYGWYQVPMGVMLLLAQALMADAVLEAGPGVKRLFADGAAPSAKGLVAPALALAMILSWQNKLNLFPARQARFTLIADWDPAREADYRRLGACLRGLAAPGDAVWLDEVGTLGFYSGLKTWDGLGLTSPDVHRARREGRDLEEVILERSPRWVLLRKADQDKPRFLTLYRPLPINRRLNLAYGQTVFERRPP